MGKHTTDATDADFDTTVLARSRTVPVLVDFWAEWCGPCRMLGPVLDKVAAAHGERLAVVKVDTDANPQVARRYGIRSIPAVKLFKDGEVVDEFVGALPEKRVLDFLGKHVLDDDARDARTVEAALAAGDVEGAARAAEALVARAPEHPRAKLARARVAMAKGDLTSAAALVDAIPLSADEFEAAQTLAAFLEHAQAGAAGVAATAAAAAARPDDAAARYALGCALAAAGRHREALDELLASVERDRRWNGEAARKAMVAVFGVLGVRAPLSDEYRRKLAILL
jgi:putative thioredoxin